MNTAEFLTIASTIVPDRDAVHFEGRHTTFGELARRSNRLANALGELGVGRGDRVAVMQVNCPEHVEAYFATARLDAVYVPVNFRAKTDELYYLLRDSEPKALLAGKRYVPLVEEVWSRLKATDCLVVVMEEPHGAPWLFYEELISKASDEETHVPQASDDDTTVLLFTAGTTATPKGVMLTHNSFASYILANVPPADPETEERNLLTVPLYHVAGIQAMLAAIYGGRTLVIQRQFDPKEWMELVQREQVDRAMLVPTMLRQLLDHPDFHRYDLSSLKVITYGAAPMPLEVIKRAIKELPAARFINAFGQTETASTITVLPSEDHVLTGTPQEIERKLRHLTSIGKPLEDVEVRIVDEDGRGVPPGHVGEIVASGSRLMKGYWRQEEATAQTLRGGWLHTGDLGYMDEDGYIYLAGRARDFIKRGGEMVSPEEVERVLHSHSKIAEAAVIGVPDPVWGERVRAIVVVKAGERLTEAEVMEHCRPRLAGFKRPESVVFVEELPRNPLGKVLKRVLRKQFSQPIADKGG